MLLPVYVSAFGRPLSGNAKNPITMSFASIRNGLAILFGKQNVQTLQTQAILTRNKIA